MAAAKTKSKKSGHGAAIEAVNAAIAGSKDKLRAFVQVMPETALAEQLPPMRAHRLARRRGCSKA